MSKNVNKYIVKSGDTLSQIAKSHDIGLRQLVQIHGNEHLNGHMNDIHPGDDIFLKPTGEHAHCYHCEHQ